MLDKLFKKIGMGTETLLIPMIDPLDANQKASMGDLTLVDVREPNEWAADGSPKDCYCIALQNSKFVDEVLLSVDNNKAASVAVVCRSGMRGEKAARLLLNAGFSDVVNVEGGMLRWLSEKLPVTS